MPSLFAVGIFFLASALVHSQVTILPGQSVDSLIARWGLTREDFAALNPEIFHNPNVVYPGQNVVIPNLGFAADDLSDFAPNNRPHDPWILYSDPDELTNSFKPVKTEKPATIKQWICRYPPVEADDLMNGGINLGEITKIAGQVHQIGQILGFDTDNLHTFKHPAKLVRPSGKNPRHHARALSRKMAQFAADADELLNGMTSSMAPMGGMYGMNPKTGGNIPGIPSNMNPMGGMFNPNGKQLGNIPGIPSNMNPMGGMFNFNGKQLPNFPGGGSMFPMGRMF